MLFPAVGQRRNATDIRAGRNPEFSHCVTGPCPEEVLGNSVRGPDLLARIGCDRNPGDPSDPRVQEVLTACIWGDQVQRLRRLQQALTVHTRMKSRGEAAQLVRVSLPDDAETFLRTSLPDNPKAPVILFNTYVTAYLNDVDHRALARTVRSVAHDWTLTHGLPWMWVRFEPARAGEPQPRAGWCRWRVTIWDRGREHDVDLGWAHPHLGDIELGSGLRQLEQLRDG